MWLLYRASDRELALKHFQPRKVPVYAILSHRWVDDEPRFQDLDPNGANYQAKRKAGYSKLEFCVREAARDGFTYSWVDTVCIDKTNSTDLQEAITSMYDWYRKSAKCYAYLNDVSGVSDFSKSAWFTRGWTLQELIAPKVVEFFSKDEEYMGTKSSLEQQIMAVTGIPVEALRGKSLSDFSVANKMKWIRKRVTTREEDSAYCMLGIFDVSMPIIYGEGNKAWHRLTRELDEKQKEPSSYMQLIPLLGNNVYDDDENKEDKDSGDDDDHSDRDEDSDTHYPGHSEDEDEISHLYLIESEEKSGNMVKWCDKNPNPHQCYCDEFSGSSEGGEGDAS